MKQSLKLLIFAAVMLAVGAITGVFTERSVEATVHSTGRHQACFQAVAIRQKPDGPARDNLNKGQTFVVTRSVGGHYVYGYKLVNGVQGWVRSSSIDKSCR